MKTNAKWKGIAVAVMFLLAFAMMPQNTGRVYAAAGYEDLNVTIAGDGTITWDLYEGAARYSLSVEGGHIDVTGAHNIGFNINTHIDQLVSHGRAEGVNPILHPYKNEYEVRVYAYATHAYEPLAVGEVQYHYECPYKNWGTIENAAISPEGILTWDPYDHNEMYYYDISILQDYGYGLDYSFGMDAIYASSNCSYSLKESIDSMIAHNYITWSGPYTIRIDAFNEKTVRLATVDIEYAYNSTTNLILMENTVVTGINGGTYTGEVYAPTYTVKYQDETLTEGTDYTVRFAGTGSGTGNIPVNAGSYVAVFEGCGRFTGVKTVPFTIEKAAATATLPTGKTLTYTGAEQTGVTGGTGYTLSGTVRATNVGSYTATATLDTSGNYTYTWSDGTTAPKTVSWRINKGAATVTPPTGKTLTYTGEEQTGVSGGTGYTLSGTVRATNAGSYTATATLNTSANYTYTWSDGTTAPKTVSWRINKADATATLPTGKTLTYTGAEQTGVTGGTGCTLSGTVRATNAGSYTATATLDTSANYTYTWSDGTTAPKTVRWRINKAGATATLPTGKELTYTGAEQTGVTGGTGYTLSGTVRATDAGSYTATATLDTSANYAYTWEDGTTAPKTVSWRINGADISGALISGITDKTYTGKAVTQSPTLKMGNVTLISGTDYTLSYQNNVNAGTAILTVTGQGNYTGTKDVFFRIIAEEGLVKIGGKWYYLNAEGEKLTGWQKISDKWYYLHPVSGEMQTGWQKISGKWYYLKPGSGEMLTGWQKISGKWYYLESGGAMCTGWKQISGKWYYLKPGSGEMLTGWQKISGKWYYLGSGGAMCTGWQKISGKWYYLKPGSGEMLTGWQKVSGKWYFMNSGGDMKTGWYKEKGKWYYFDAGNGAMLANTSRKIGSKTYRFNRNGVCTNP